MKTFSWIVSALGLFTCFNSLNASPQYETYLESWDSKWQSALTGMPPGPGDTPTYQNVMLNIAFAAYVFDSTENTCAKPNPTVCPNFADCKNTTSCSSLIQFASSLNGIQFSPCDALCIVNYVHANGGTARISYGGASYALPYAPYYFISQTPGWPGNAQALAQGVIDVVSQYGFDGVDFDIEDPLPSGTTPDEFAAQLINFLQYVKNGLPSGKIISITIPGQGWGTYWMPLAQQAAAMNLVDYINFMEYDIWVNPTLPEGYPEQITADITTYSAPTNTSPAPNYAPGWGIPLHYIQLGLMPGDDDNGQFLSVSDAASLAANAAKEDLVGVMTWDLDRDAQTDPHPPLGDAEPYEYTTTIREALTTPSKLTKPFGKKRKTKGNLTPLLFIRQFPPPHGAPPTNPLRMPEPRYEEELKVDFGWLRRHR